jgi:hypothetical protein
MPHPDLPFHLFSLPALHMANLGFLPGMCRDGEKLCKAERYGHPSERPIFASGLPPDSFEQLVASYFEHGLRGVAPKVGGWTWDELHAVNESIDWQPWKLAQLQASGVDAAAERRLAGAGVLKANPPVHPSLQQR